MTQKIVALLVVCASAVLYAADKPTPEGHVTLKNNSNRAVTVDLYFAYKPNAQALLDALVEEEEANALKGIHASNAATLKEAFDEKDAAESAKSIAPGSTRDVSLNKSDPLSVMQKRVLEQPLRITRLDITDDQDGVTDQLLFDEKAFPKEFAQVAVPFSKKREHRGLSLDSGKTPKDGSGLSYSIQERDPQVKVTDADRTKRFFKVAKKGQASSTASTGARLGDSVINSQYQGI